MFQSRFVIGGCENASENMTCFTRHGFAHRRSTQMVRPRQSAVKRPEAIPPGLRKQTNSGLCPCSSGLRAVTTGFQLFSRLHHDLLQFSSVVSVCPWRRDHGGSRRPQQSTASVLRMDYTSIYHVWVFHR